MEESPLAEELVSEVPTEFVPAAESLLEKLGFSSQFPFQSRTRRCRSGSRLSAAVNFIQKRLSTAGSLQRSSAEGDRPEVPAWP